MAIFIKVNMDNTLLIFLGSGGLGGFTTFSTFNYEIANIFLRHEFRKLFLYFFSIYGIAIGGAIIILKILKFNLQINGKESAIIVAFFLLS